MIAIVGLLIGFTVPVKSAKQSVIIAPTITPISAPKEISSDKLLTLVNEWRVSEDRQPYVKDERLCNIAKDRVENDSPMDNHEGFIRKYSSYPYAIQENLVTETSEAKMLTRWLNSVPHHETLNKPYTHTCIACKEHYCSQIFSSF